MRKKAKEQLTGEDDQIILAILYYILGFKIDWFNLETYRMIYVQSKFWKIHEIDVDTYFEALAHH